jgi:hypothetical protein
MLPMKPSAAPSGVTILGLVAVVSIRDSFLKGQRHFADEDALFDACSTHFRSLNPPPDLRDWSEIADPAARTEAGLGELYAFYGRTRGMYESLFRDETLVPGVHRRLRDFHGYLQAAEDVLMTGRGLRGGLARRTRAVIGHALTFATWRSLVQEQRLAADEAVALMSELVRNASRR